MRDPTIALALAVVVAAVYIGVLRAVDVNEKEPLWALCLVLAAGVLAGLAAPAVASTATIEFERLTGAIVQETAKLAALGAGIVGLQLIGRLRGFSEINGVTDGILYGAAAGLGYAVGDTLHRDLAATGILEPRPQAFTLIWATALYGLAHGLFSTLTGAGLAAALLARSAASRLALAVAGLAGAVGLHLLFVLLRGSVLEGSAAPVRTWIALALPVAVVATALVLALARERRVIARELAEEVENGTLSDADLQLLERPAARRRAYTRRFFRGDFDGWLALRGLQNRQVQLALAKRRGRSAADTDDVERLRTAVRAARSELDAGSPAEGARA